MQKDSPKPKGHNRGQEFPREGGFWPEKGGVDEEMAFEYDSDGDGTLSENGKSTARESRKQELIANMTLMGNGVLSDSEKKAMHKDLPQDLTDLLPEILHQEQAPELPTRRIL
jgi:hypothetical protein